MPTAGYSAEEAEEVKSEVAHYEKVREEVKLASGDYVDMKMYEPAMRHLLDSYIKADESKKLSAFDDLTLVQLIVDKGIGALDRMPDGLRENPEATAEAIENNVRRLIIDESPANPKYFEKMSELLDALVKQRRQQALSYTAYLERIAELAKKVQQPENSTGYPAAIKSKALQALYDNLGHDETVAVRVDEIVRATKKDGWRGHRPKERELRAALRRGIGGTDAQIDEIFELVKAQREY
jgi:type I restriction enzyme R subunit